MKPTSIAVILLLFGIVLAGAPPSTASATYPPKKMMFRGNVKEVAPGAKFAWFVMNGGGSKKYQRVKILVNPRTKWEGLGKKPRKLPIGAPVCVDGVQVSDLVFRATRIEGLDPEAAPNAAKFGKNR